MLFLLGSRSPVLASQPLTGVACAGCGTVGSVTAVVFARYAHVFFIPILSTGKDTMTVCQHCKQTLSAHETPQTYRPVMRTLLETVKIPLWHYLGLLVMGGLLALLVVVGIIGRIQAPPDKAVGAEVVGALYKINDRVTGKEIFDGKPMRHAFVQVTKVTRDSVYCRVTEMLYSRATAASAAVALRDSVPPRYANQGCPSQQWHDLTTDTGPYKPFVE